MDREIVHDRLVTVDSKGNTLNEYELQVVNGLAYRTQTIVKVKAPSQLDYLAQSFGYVCAMGLGLTIVFLAAYGLFKLGENHKGDRSEVIQTVQIYG